MTRAGCLGTAALGRLARAGRPAGMHSRLRACSPGGPSPATWGKASGPTIAGIGYRRHWQRPAPRLREPPARWAALRPAAAPLPTGPVARAPARGAAPAGPRARADLCTVSRASSSPSWRSRASSSPSWRRRGEQARLVAVVAVFDDGGVMCRILVNAPPRETPHRLLQARAARRAARRRPGPRASPGSDSSSRYGNF